MRFMSSKIISSIEKILKASIIPGMETLRFICFHTVTLFKGITQVTTKADANK